MSELRQWCPKILREQLCNQQHYAPDRFSRDEIQRLIDVLDLHRPTASDGKHGSLHTPTCGCDDQRPPVGSIVAWPNGSAWLLRPDGWYHGDMKQPGADLTGAVVLRQGWSGDR